jgi:hypothetical protein
VKSDERRLQAIQCGYSASRVGLLVGVADAPVLEDMMSTNVNRSRALAVGPSAAVFTLLAPGVDVPGMLADRIGDLYATEELRRRNQRTERMILKAQSIK